MKYGDNAMVCWVTPLGNTAELVTVVVMPDAAT